MNDNRLINYVALLRIREKGARRDMLIVGILFFVVLTGLMVAFVRLEDWTGRMLYFAPALIVMLGVIYSTVFARYQIIKEAIALADNLS